jgi:hypothetical protein
VSNAKVKTDCKKDVEIFFYIALYFQLETKPWVYNTLSFANRTTPPKRSVSLSLCLYTDTNTHIIKTQKLMICKNIHTHTYRHTHIHKETHTYVRTQTHTNSYMVHTHTRSRHPISSRAMLRATHKAMQYT